MFFGFVRKEQNEKPRFRPVQTVFWLKSVLRGFFGRFGKIDSQKSVDKEHFPKTKTKMLTWLPLQDTLQTGQPAGRLSELKRMATAVGDNAQALAQKQALDIAGVCEDLFCSPEIERQVCARAAETLGAHIWSSILPGTRFPRSPLSCSTSALDTISAPLCPLVYPACSRCCAKVLCTRFRIQLTDTGMSEYGVHNMGRHLQIQKNVGACMYVHVWWTQALFPPPATCSGLEAL